MAIRQLVEAAGIPQISMAGGTVVTGQFSPNVYQTPWINNLLIPFLFDNLVGDDYNSIALVTDSSNLNFAIATFR
jgi:hypothetical protein